MKIPNPFPWFTSLNSRKHPRIRHGGEAELRLRLAGEVAPGGAATQVLPGEWERPAGEISGEAWIPG